MPPMPPCRRRKNHRRKTETLAALLGSLFADAAVAKAAQDAGTVGGGHRWMDRDDGGKG